MLRLTACHCVDVSTIRLPRGECFVSPSKVGSVTVRSEDGGAAGSATNTCRSASAAMNLRLDTLFLLRDAVGSIRGVGDGDLFSENPTAIS